MFVRIIALVNRLETSLEAVFGVINRDDENDVRPDCRLNELLLFAFLVEKYEV